MLFKFFTTSSPANLAAATTTRAGSQSQRASPPPAPISKASKLRGIFQTPRRFVAPPQVIPALSLLARTVFDDADTLEPGCTGLPSPRRPHPRSTKEQHTRLRYVLDNPTPDSSNYQPTPPLSIAASWVSYKSESPSIDRPNADTRRDSGRSWSSSWFDFERITAGSEPQRGGSTVQEPSDVSEGEETCSEESGEGSRASGRSWSSSWYEFERIPAGSDPQRIGSAWQAPSDVSEGEASCSDSEYGERSWASTDPSLGWANSESDSPSPSPSAPRRMPRGRQGGRMYAMRVTSAYGSSTDEDDFTNFLLR